MSSNKLFVWNGESYDLTRWISFEKMDDHLCRIHLGDLCSPAKVSCLTAVVCPATYLLTSLELGALQMTLLDGYVLLRRDRQFINLEFRGREDESLVRVSFVAQDLKSALDLTRNDPLRSNPVAAKI